MQVYRKTTGPCPSKSRRAAAPRKCYVSNHPPIYYRPVSAFACPTSLARIHTLRDQAEDGDGAHEQHSVVELGWSQLFSFVTTSRLHQ